MKSNTKHYSYFHCLNLCCYQVQWAKAIGCHVIATCSAEEKENILKVIKLKVFMLIYFLFNKKDTLCLKLYTSCLFKANQYGTYFWK